MEKDLLITLTADIVASHVENNQVPMGDVDNLIQQVHQALASLSSEAPAPTEEKSPAVPIRSSVKPDYITCLECGKKQKTLKRHLQSAHGMTPAQYRKEYGLTDAYPMTAPTYSEARRSMAHLIGLGRKKKDEGEGTVAAAAPKAKRGGGRSKK